MPIFAYMHPFLSVLFTHLLPIFYPHMSVVTLREHLWKAMDDSSLSLFDFPSLHSYVEYIRNIVSANMRQAMLGGIPGTYPLVQAFLKIKLPVHSPGLEVGMALATQAGVILKHD